MSFLGKRKVPIKRQGETVEYTGLKQRRKGIKYVGGNYAPETVKRAKKFVASGMK